jgi:antitoxin HicB
MAKARTTPTRTKRTETMQRGTYRYTAIFEPAEEGGYVVTVPALNGLTTEGDTLEEARAMAADAIRCHLESLQKHGEEIPVESDAPIMRRIAVSLSRA